MSSPHAELFRLGNDVLKHPFGSIVGPMRNRGPAARMQPSVDSERGSIRELCGRDPVPFVANHGGDGLCNDPTPLTVSPVWPPRCCGKTPLSGESAPPCGVKIGVVPGWLHASGSPGCVILRLQA
jgi:hypothetical protein